MSRTPKTAQQLAALVGRYYSEKSFAFESHRLERYCPVEFAITRRVLARFVPDSATVAEVGVGVGHYSELLARRGCRLYLADVSERLLEAARERLCAGGLEYRVQDLRVASATDLGHIPSSTADWVLFLGPLYHLWRREDRATALAEASRILKPGGGIVAGGINWLAYLRDHFLPLPETSESRKVLLDEVSQGHVPYLEHRNLDPKHAPPIGYAHMTTVAEFRRELREYFRELLLTGAESFTMAWQGEFLKLPPEEQELWVDLVEKTALTSEGMAYSDHFIFVGRKRAS